MPTSRTPAVRSAVATGRRMKRREGFIAGANYTVAAGNPSSLLRPPPRAPYSRPAAVARGCRAASPLYLLVEPGVLEPAAVVHDIVRDQVLHVGMVGEAIHPPAHDGPRGLFLEPLLDLGHQGQPLGRVRLLRLLLDELHDALVAVTTIVPRGAAGVVLEEVGVGIVHPEPGEVGRDLELPAGGEGMPLRGFDLLEGGLHPDRLQLVDHEGGEVEIDSDGAGGHLHAQRMAGTEARLRQQLLRAGLLVGAL